jgi:TetR/AcrR family transcriptional regulator
MRSASAKPDSVVPKPSAKKAARTRSAILTAAENLFAKRGYEATRLEDVAEAVGLTRAALFYYFRDKEMLHEAMLEDAFGSLAKHLDEALSAPGPIAKRLELAVNAWVDALVERPTIASLILRYVADSEERRPTQSIYITSERLFRTYWALFEQGRASGELKPLHDNPFHAASAVIGHTVFYVNALSALIPFGSFKPSLPKQVSAHKSDLLHTVQRQLGITTGRRAKKTD